MDPSRLAVGMRASWRKAGIVLPFHKPARFYAESPGAEANVFTTVGTSSLKNGSWIFAFGKRAAALRIPI
jgi:hypothetical protein